MVASRCVVVRSSRGPSTTRPGTHNPRARKSRVAPVGDDRTSLRFGGAARHALLFGWVREEKAGLLGILFFVGAFTRDVE